MTHPLRVAENCPTHPLHKAQNLMTHPLSAPAHPRLYFLTNPLVIYDDLTQTDIEWLPIVRLSWLPFSWREQEVILNTLGCRLSCKNKSIKRKSCFEEQTPFCGLLLVSILNSCLEYRLNEVSCAYLHFLSVLPKTFVKYKSSRFFYRQTRSFLSPSWLFLKKGFKLL